MKSVLKHVVEAALDKNAEDVLVLDLRGLCDFTDYFVICHGSNSRQVLAIAEAIEERVRVEDRLKPKHVEGRRVAAWVLMDFIDFVVHVFQDEKREFFGLERLWGDAKRLTIPGTTSVVARTARRRPGVSR